MRVAGLLHELAREWDVTLVSPCRDADKSALPDKIRFVSIPRAQDAFRLTIEERTALNETVMRVADSERPDAVLLWARIGASAFAGTRSGNVVIDFVDCHTLETWRAMRLARQPLDALRLGRDCFDAARNERRLGRDSFATVAVGEDDARVLRRVIGRDCVHVVPNGIHLGVRDSTARDPRPTVCFTGVMGYPPNFEAVLFFAREVWPAVKRQVPDAVFLVAGRDPTPEITALQAVPGVEILGSVPDMPDVLRRSWLAVAPMQSGTGIKNKVLEAWAVGTPVILTPMAANGLGDSPVIRELTRRQPGDLATLTVSLLRDNDSRERLGDAVYDLARERSWAAVARPLSDLLLRAAGTTRTQAGIPQPVS